MTTQRPLTFNWEDIGGHGGYARACGLSLCLYNINGIWSWKVKDGEGHPGLSLTLADSRKLGEGLGYHTFGEAAIACENYVVRNWPVRL
jgi:hypothetical protein